MSKDTIVSLTELKKNPVLVLEKVKNDPVYLLKRSEVAAVMVDPELFESMVAALEDEEDAKAIQESKADKRGRDTDYKKFRKQLAV